MAEHLKLWDKTPLFDETIGQEEPFLTPYLIPTNLPWKTPANLPIGGGAIIVVPGGGYSGLANIHEGHQIAQWLNTLGYQAFVLTYRVAPYRAPCPHMDLSRAVRYLRAHAADYAFDPQKIGAIGFSAGGHLVSSVATHFDDGIDGDAIDAVSNRLNYAMLIYSVITADREKGAHMGSFSCLLGDRATDEQQRDYWSSEKQVSDQTPPIFLCHAADDACVPANNSFLFAQACKDHHVPVELHLYPRGGHGFGLAFREPHTARWAKDAEAWLKIYAAAPTAD